MENNLPEVVERVKAKNRHKKENYMSTGLLKFNSLTTFYKEPSALAENIKIGVSNNEDGKIKISFNPISSHYIFCNREIYLTLDEAKTLRNNLNKAIRKAVMNG